MVPLFHLILVPQAGWSQQVCVPQVWAWSCGRGFVARYASGQVFVDSQGVPLEWADLVDSEHDPGLWEEDGVVLGKGAFGVVARGINRRTGELVAVKRIAPSHNLAVATAKNEVEAAKKLGEHPNIVQMKAYFMSPLEDGAQRDVVLVYRLALGGDLQQWINKQHGNSFSVDYGAPKFTDEALRLMRQLVAALQHIHSKNIQHRDLKPANILLSAGCTALIADFGIALVDRSSQRLRGHAALGDFYFIDVDSLVTKELPYTLDDDIYSLGEVFVRILYGRYGSGVDLRRFLETASDVPEVVQVLGEMLDARPRRCGLRHVADILDDLRFRSKESEPRPIVMSMFLGIGSVATVSAVMDHLRRKEFRKRDISIFSKKSALQASFCVGQTQGQRQSLQDYYCHARIPWAIHAGARSWRLMGMFDGQQEARIAPSSRPSSCPMRCAGCCGRRRRRLPWWIEAGRGSAPWRFKPYSVPWRAWTSSM